jgi:hypothetical protein
MGPIATELQISLVSRYWYECCSASYASVRTLRWPVEKRDSVRLNAVVSYLRRTFLNQNLYWHSIYRANFKAVMACGGTVDASGSRCI